MKPICFRIENAEGAEIEHLLPSRWTICDSCRGGGTRDHRAFSNGLSQEDFDEDPDFREEYMAGRYDVRCDDCDSSGKVLVPDESAMNPEQVKLLELYHNQRAELARDIAADAYTRQMENGGY